MPWCAYQAGERHLIENLTAWAIQFSSSGQGVSIYTIFVFSDPMQSCQLNFAIYDIISSLGDNGSGDSGRLLDM